MPCHRESRGFGESGEKAQGSDVWKQGTPCFFDRYELGQRVASGLKGVVYTATEKQTGQQVAVKKPRNPWDTSDYDLLSQKHHPNIVRVLDCLSDASWATYIVMEWCAGGDLFHAIKSLPSPPSETWVAHVFVQLLWATSYLHDEFGESHNDIKPENLLFSRDPSDMQDSSRLMLADFGCAAKAESLTQKSGGGDPRYRAPETFKGAPFGFCTDVWAAGVVLYEILSSGLLIYTREHNLHGFYEFRKHRHGELCREYMRKLVSGSPVDVSGVAGPEAQALLSGLLRVVPRERASVQDAIQHPWIVSRGVAAPVSIRCKDDDAVAEEEAPKSPTKKNARGGC